MPVSKLSVARFLAFGVAVLGVALTINQATCLAADAAAESKSTDNKPSAAKPVVVLAREQTLSLPQAKVEGDDLLVPLDQVTAITGFELKPQGLCAGDICLAMPAKDPWVVERDGKKMFSATRFARAVDQVYTADRANNVWSFTAVPQAPTSPLLSGQAPDFALQDRAGKTVRLSDFRGKKVLLWTWASWCACRLDMAGWQKLYEELKDQNFEIVAAAQDSGGMSTAGVWYDKNKATFTALVDPHHTVSSLYQMVNVPTGVWIDEQGQIVRPGEVAYSKEQKILGQTIGDDRYAAGVRDWVANGSKSSYVMSPEKLKARLALRSPELRQADAYFKLGVYFHELGDRDAAAANWQRSQALNPDSWNYHRQQWAFNKSTEMTNWFGKVGKLQGKPYYEPADFAGAVSGAQPAK